MKKVLSIIGGFLCVFVCMFLFGLQIAFMTFTSVKSIVSKDSITKIVNNIDVKEIISSNPETASNLYGFFDTLGFSTDDTDKILNSEAFKEFLNEYLYSNIENLLEDKDVVVSYDAVVDLISKIESETNLTFKNKEVYLKVLEQKFSEISKSINISNTIRKEIGEENLELIRVILSNTITIVFIVVFVIIYLIMCLLRWSMYKPLIWFGITTTLASFVMLQVFIAITSATNLINDESYKSFELIIMPVLKVIKEKGLIVSSVMLAIGIAMIVAFALIHRSVQEKKDKEEFKMLDNAEPENKETL